MKVEGTPPGAHPLRSLEVEFDVVRELGRGGSSVVYLAVERELEREVAIKTIHPLFASDPDAVARLVREARTLARLQHPNIVTFYGVRHLAGGGLAVVMQYVRGERLKDRIQAHGPLGIEETRAVLADVARALAYVHRHHVVHRDIKPENIYLDQELGMARLSDFGIARAWDRDASLTQAGLAIGTPAYMAPEQIDGAPPDGRSDLYSLGLVGYEMLSGERPWAGQNLYGIIYRQKNEALPPLAGLRPDVPETLRSAIEGALEKDPERRWPSADAFLECLSGDATWTAPASPAGVAPAAIAAAPPPMATPPVPARDDALTVPYRVEDLRAAPPPESIPAETPAGERAETAPAAETGDAALIAQLERALGLAEGEALDPGEAREEPVPALRRGRRRAMAIAAGLALALAGSVSAFSLLRSRGDESAGPRRAGSSLTRLAASAVEPAWAAPAPRPPASAPTALPAETAATPTAKSAPRVKGGEPVAAPTRAPRHDPDPVLLPPPEIRVEVTPPPRVDLAPSDPAPPTPGPPVLGRAVVVPAPPTPGPPVLGRAVVVPALPPPGPPVLGRALVAPGTRHGDEVAGGRSVRDTGGLKEIQAGPPVADPSAAPTFTPFQVAPVLRNREDVQRALLHVLPAVTRETANPARVLVWVLIDTRGVVQKAQVKQSSGFAPLDRAALQVAARMKFTAALNGDQPVSVWVSVPVDFSVR